MVPQVRLVDVSHAVPAITNMSQSPQASVRVRSHPRRGPVRPERTRRHPGLINIGCAGLTLCYSYSQELLHRAQRQQQLGYHSGGERNVSKASVIWWALSGGLFSLLIGVVGAMLATANGSSIAGAVMVGAAAFGGFAALWITGTSAVHVYLNGHQKPGTDAGDAKD